MRLKTYTFFLWCITSLLFCAVQSFAAPVVSNIRLGEHNTKTRVVFESTDKLQPNVFTLVNPNRVVLDFKNTEVNADYTEKKINSSLMVSTVRQGLFKPGVHRVVFELKKPAEAKVFNLPPRGGKPHRFVVDLFPTATGNEQVVQLPFPREHEPAEVKENAPVLPRFNQAAEEAGPIIIVVDPGHGGIDPGAIGGKKHYEKNVVLGVAKKLAAKINATPGYKAYLTRNKDIFIPLGDRVKFAQEKRADMFISIHADANNTKSVKGGSVYVLSDKASDREAARLAKAENQSDLIAGIDLGHESPEVRDILISLTQRETLNRSSLLAQSVLHELGDVTYLRKKHPLFAGFKVLKAPDIPSILVELAYMSNPNESRMLRTSAFHTKAANALHKGLVNYATAHIHTKHYAAQE